MDGRLSDDPTGQVFAWQKLSQAELDQIAHDSHKQRQARLMVRRSSTLTGMKARPLRTHPLTTRFPPIERLFLQKDPPKCSYCPKARFTSLTMYTTHCQSKAHRVRVREFQKTQRKSLESSLARTSTNTQDPSGTDGQASGDSLDGMDTRTLTCNDADKGVDSAEFEEDRSFRPEPSCFVESRERKRPDSGKPQVKKAEAAGQTPDPRERNLKGTNANTRKSPRCFLCHGSTLRKHSLKSHFLSTKHMKAVRKLMQTWSGPIPPSSEADVLSAMDPYCWGAVVGAEEERDEEAEEEEEEDIDILPAFLEGDSYDSLSAQEVDMDLSE